jgi:Icc-related predicted phosphoesterase
VRRVKPYVPNKTFKHLYQALVQPHFDYCSMVLGNCGEYLRGKLQKLKTELHARVITCDPYEIRSIDILKKLGWKTLSEKTK